MGSKLISEEILSTKNYAEIETQTTKALEIINTIKN
jgi:hypothetical protein